MLRYRTVVPALFALSVAIPAVAQPLTIPVLPETPHNYANIELPDHYLLNRIPGNPPGQSSVIATDNTPADNPTTDAGATLGRVLFYDIKLSANGTTSCASCHIQSNGFSDPNTLSVGFAGETTRRHSMGLANARFNAAGSFFWDERAETLEDQVLMPFQDPAEMGLTLNELVSIVQDQSYYPELFTDAFGDPAVDTDRISKALAQFVRSIVSVTSRYDQGAEQVADPTQPFPNFTAQENLGKTLFFAPIPAGGASCSACHVTEGFVNPSNAPPGLTTSTNNGLDAVSTDDLGVAETSLLVQDEGKFRVPSLKNIGVTEPYMHDGRFATLEDVIQHYNTGIQPHPNLSPVLRRPGGQPARLNLSNQQVNALAAFMRTLTDTALLNDERYADPFVTICSFADLAAPFGTLNIDDLDVWVDAFRSGDLLADCDANGVLNLDDLDCFIAAFLAGCDG